MKDLHILRRNYHGKGSVLFKWDPHGKYLATCGANRRVHIFERNGELYDEFALNGPKGPIQMEWNKDGEVLAVLQDSCSTIPLWNVHEKRAKELETNCKDPSFMTWARAGPMLAVGTAKGNLFLYSTATLKSTLLQGKHSKKITCGMWNLDNKLALASQDKMMTISDEKGATLEQAKLKYDPYDIQFAEQKVDEKNNYNASSSGENTVSINMGHQTILMYNMSDTENPVELAFQVKYGEIASYKWFGDGYMMVGFSKGYIIAISTHMKEIGEELQSLKIHEVLYDVVYSPQLNKLATCGDDGVRIVDMSDWKEIKGDHREFSKEEGDPEKMEWTKDGQILTVSTNGGYVFNFLMSIPVLSAFNGSRLAYLYSLRHVSIIDVSNDNNPATTLEIAVEPAFMALGPGQVAVGMNNHAWFYNLSKDLPSSPAEREYLGTVSSIQLNDQYAAVLCDGKLLLHLIISNPSSEHDSRMFPEKEDHIISACALTNDFLVYSTTAGTLHHFYIKDWAFVNEYRHDAHITHVYSSSLGTRCIFIDIENKGFLYSPVDDHRVEIEKFPHSVESVLWEPNDSAVFVAVDAKANRNLVTYAYTPQSIKGPSVTRVCNTKVPYGFTSIMFHDGCVHGQKATGALSVIALSSHDAINQKSRRSTEKLRHALSQLLALNRLKGAWELSLIVKSKELYQALARKAMEQLDIDTAIRVYRELKDTAMVLALTDIQHVEDKHLLAGHICLLNAEYNRAQGLFLNSSSPISALHMRRDLLHWDQALKLAETLAPEEIPHISREYATQLEVKGEYSEAEKQYYKSLQEAPGAPSGKTIITAEQKRQSNGGIARMKLRQMDFGTGKRLAFESNDKALQKECAAILESMRQFSDAADMYLSAENFEKAALLYCTMTQFNKAQPLMAKITTPKIHSQYAKAKEEEATKIASKAGITPGSSSASLPMEAIASYNEAASAYMKARDFDSVVRLYLDYLSNPEGACSIVRQNKSPVGAALIAAYFAKPENNNMPQAIEFLLLAKRSEEAFALARKHKAMDLYARALGPDDLSNHDDYLLIAAYYEEERDWSKAAHYYALLNDYSKAIKLYLTDENPHIDEAIEVVKKANGHPGTEQLVRQLHDYLLGETDGKVKDLNYIFRLYMAIGEYVQAANTATLIANQEQQCGQYKNAHKILLSMQKELMGQKLSIPTDLSKSLLLLHSYILAKEFSHRKQNEAAARMLIRCAKNISKFPAHIVPILTSATIECHRAGLAKSALTYASMLMRNEYRNLVDKKFAKPIENLVRRPSSNDDIPENTSPCPYCSFEVPNSQLDCPQCKNHLPYCVTTGNHMVADDWTICPSCSSPSLYSAFINRIKIDGTCNMCSQLIKLSDINKITDVNKFLRKDMDGADNKQNVETNKKADSGASGPSGSAVDIEPRFD